MQYPYAHAIIPLLELNYLGLHKNVLFSRVIASSSLDDNYSHLKKDLELMENYFKHILF